LRTLDEFPIQVKLPVVWGELDALNHVNNIWYFRYIETARVKYFDETGLTEDIYRSGIGPVVMEAKCSFYQPLLYPDNIVSAARIKSIGNTSFVMEHLIVSEKLGVVAGGECVVVLFNSNTKQKAAISEQLKTAINKLEGDRSWD